MNDDYISITQLNDFLFCPKSLYFGSVYKQSFSNNIFQDKPQVAGASAHYPITTHKYSSKTSILQDYTVYSYKLKLIGKIDTYDIIKATLTERKNKISAIYEGLLMQIYAQAICLTEMGYHPELLRFYEYSTNKIYPIKFSYINAYNKVANVIEQMHSFTDQDLLNHHCSHCAKNIYTGLNFDVTEK